MPPKKPKRNATTQAPAAAPSGATRIGFAPAARDVFDSLSEGVRNGLRRKLRDFGQNPAIGKPLVAELRGYRGITYGRLRTIASVEMIATVVAGTVLVLVVYIGPRAAGSRRDPYEMAAEALRRGDEDAREALELLAQQLHAGGLEGEE